MVRGSSSRVVCYDAAEARVTVTGSRSNEKSPEYTSPTRRLYVSDMETLETAQVVSDREERWTLDRRGVRRWRCWSGQPAPLELLVYFNSLSPYKDAPGLSSNVRPVQVEVCLVFVPR